MIRRAVNVECGAMQKRVNLVDLEKMKMDGNEAFIAKFGVDATETGPSKVWVTYPRPPAP